MASAETVAKAALSALGCPVYADRAPAGCAVPYAVFQSMPGQVTNDLDNSVDLLQNNRVQVATWSLDKGQSVTLMQTARRLLMRAAKYPTAITPIGSAGSVYEDDTKLYGQRLDFSIWFQE